jgi:hypothetical protein
MKTFLQHAKELEREELERQMHRHFEMAQKSLATAQQLEMAGDMDGYKTFMAKHHHFQTQGDYLKNALNESFANDFLAMAKKRVPSAQVRSPQEKKQTDISKSGTKPQSSGGEKYPLGGYDAKSGRSYSEEVELDEVAAWQRKEGKNPSGGLNKKGIASYRRETPGSKLSMAVTTEPSKLKKGSKAWNRRKSFCARMGGMPGPMKDEKGRPTRKALSLRKWNC